MEGKWRVGSRGQGMQFSVSCKYLRERKRKGERRRESSNVCQTLSPEGCVLRDEEEGTCKPRVQKFSVVFSNHSWDEVLKGPQARDLCIIGSFKNTQMAARAKHNVHFRNHKKSFVFSRAERTEAWFQWSMFLLWVSLFSLASAAKGTFFLLQLLFVLCCYDCESRGEILMPHISMRTRAPVYRDFDKAREGARGLHYLPGLEKLIVVGLVSSAIWKIKFNWFDQRP